MIIPSKEQLKKMFSGIDQPFLLQTTLFFAAFIVPLIIIYILDAGSFDYLWKGRAPYILFLWLLFLEAALGWKKLKTEPPVFWTKKTVLAAVTLLLPTVYALGLNFGLQSGIVELGKAVGVPAEQFGEMVPNAFMAVLIRVYSLCSVLCCFDLASVWEAGTENLCCFLILYRRRRHILHD